MKARFFPVMCTILSLFAAASSRADLPSPQLDLPRTTLRFGTNLLTAQIAADAPSRETGLMSRTNLGTDEGMVFVFPKPGPVAFWMKNTTVPLTVAYAGPSGRIFEIHELRPLDETPVPSVSSSVSYAIEVPQGWFARHGVLAGDVAEGLPSAGTAR